MLSSSRDTRGCQRGSHLDVERLAVAERELDVHRREADRGELAAAPVRGDVRHGDDGGEGEPAGEVGEELEVEGDADAELVLEACSQLQV